MLFWFVKKIDIHIVLLFFMIVLCSQKCIVVWNENIRWFFFSRTAEWFLCLNSSFDLRSFIQKLVFNKIILSNLHEKYLSSKFSLLILCIIFFTGAWSVAGNAYLIFNSHNLLKEYECFSVQQTTRLTVMDFEEHVLL